MESTPGAFCTMPFPCLQGTSKPAKPPFFPLHPDSRSLGACTLIAAVHPAPFDHPAPPRVLLPVIVLEALIPQEQVPEAVARGQGEHLGVQLVHRQGGDVQDDPALAAAAASPSSAAAGRRLEPARERGVKVMGGWSQAEGLSPLPGALCKGDHPLTAVRVPPLQEGTAAIRPSPV